MQLLLLLLAVTAAEPEPAVEVAKIDVGQAKKVEIVRQDVSNKGTELLVVLNPKDEQFTVDFDWDATDFQHVRILVKGAKKWDTVRYFPTVKHSRGKTFFNLMKTRGVNVDGAGNDCAIDFVTPASLKLLPPAVGWFFGSPPARHAPQLGSGRPQGGTQVAGSTDGRPERQPRIPTDRSPAYSGQPAAVDRAPRSKLDCARKYPAGVPGRAGRQCRPGGGPGRAGLSRDGRRRAGRVPRRRARPHHRRPAVLVAQHPLRRQRSAGRLDAGRAARARCGRVVFTAISRLKDTDAGRGALRWASESCSDFAARGFRRWPKHSR